MKMKKEQLVETIRDCIYEVLEEEIDRKLQEQKNSKSKLISKKPTPSQIRKAKAKKLTEAKQIKAKKQRILAKKMQRIVDTAKLRESKSRRKRVRK